MLERRQWISVVGLFVLAISALGCASDTPPAATAAQDPAAAVEQAPAAVAADSAVEGSMKEMMPGCSGTGGACCGSCQEKMKQADAAEKPMGGCPCQRARQARERAKQEQAGS